MSTRPCGIDLFSTYSYSWVEVLPLALYCDYQTIHGTKRPACDEAVTEYDGKKMQLYALNVSYTYYSGMHHVHDHLTYGRNSHVHRIKNSPASESFNMTDTSIQHVDIWPRPGLEDKAQALLCKVGDLA